MFGVQRRSQPGVLRSEWVRQLSDWDRQQNVPKKYQNKPLFKKYTNKQPPTKTEHTPPFHSIFILVCRTTLGSQNHILNVFFLGVVKEVLEKYDLAKFKRETVAEKVLGH